jgi:hypothetical protein
MHLSLKGSMDRQPLTDRLGDRLLAEYGGAAAAYSLRALNGNGDSVVRVRRASDNDEKDFTAEQIELGEMVNWVNSQTVPPLDIGVETSEGRIPVPEGGTSIGTPAAAYSLRNLSTTYTGNVVDVRRSSGGTESFTAAEVADGTLADWVSEDTTQYMQFDGVGVNVDTNTQLLPATADFSLAISFVATGNPAADEYLFGSDTSVVGRYFVKLTSSGTVQIFVNGIGSVTTANALNANELNTVIFRRTGTTLGVSLNGGTEATMTGASAIETTTNAIIGNYIGLSPFNGLITSLTVGATTWNGSQTDAVAKGWTVNGSPTSTLLNDGFVSKWYDQSGNDNHATQGTAAKQPKIVDGGSLVSGGNKFDGTNDFLTFPDRFLSGSFAISTVFNLQDRDKTNNTLFGYSNNTGFIRYQGSNRLGFKISGPESFINLTLANNTDYVMSITRDASNLVSLYVDGSFIGSFTQSGQFSLDRIGVFAESSSYFLQGTMTETLIYNSDQSANRTAIEANIGETYGITGIPAYDNTVDGFVETWYDQSGNGNDATQSVAASQPKIVNAGVLVSGGLDFDGVDDVLGTSLVPPNVATLIGVANWDVEDQTLMIIGARDGVTQRSYIAQSSSGKSSLGVSTSLFADGDIVAGDDYLLFGVHSGSTRLLSTNGSVISDSLGSAPNNTIQGYSVGALNTAGTNDAFMDGTLAEVIVYNSDQSANRVAIETNINDHYNIY